MKKSGMSALAAVMAFAGAWGCSKSDKGDKAPAPLTTTIAPQGGLHENKELAVTVTLTVNRAGALIYYTMGAPTPPDPTTTSSIYNPATPLSIDTGYANATCVVKYFAWHKDPASGVVEQENVKTTTYGFVEDAKPPVVYINSVPSGSSHADPSEVTITITASDTHDTSDLIDVFYTTTTTTAQPADPRQPGAQTGKGNGTEVPWASTRLNIRAVARDQAGHFSNLVNKTFTIDHAKAVQKVLELINADRKATSPLLNDLAWNSTWAAGCDGHCEQVFLAEQALTTEKPGASLVTWYNPADPQKRQLLDFDHSTTLGEFVVAAAAAMGNKVDSLSATDFYNMIKSLPTIWDILMSAQCDEFACGFYENVWEMLCTYQ